MRFFPESELQVMATAAVEGGFVDFQAGWAELKLPESVREVLNAAPLVQTPETRAQLMDWALGRSSGDTDWTLGNRDDHGQYEAVFQAPGAGRIVEAVITKARNGLAINFPDPAMRRRDPDAMVIGTNCRQISLHIKSGSARNLKRLGLRPSTGSRPRNSSQCRFMREQTRWDMGAC